MHKYAQPLTNISVKHILLKIQISVFWYTNLPNKHILSSFKSSFKNVSDISNCEGISCTQSFHMSGKIQIWARTGKFQYIDLLFLEPFLCQVGFVLWFDGEFFFFTFSCLTKACRFSAKIDRFLKLSMISLHLTRAEAKQLYNIMLPAPCFTVDILIFE